MLHLSRRWNLRVWSEFQWIQQHHFLKLCNRLSNLTNDRIFIVKIVNVLSEIKFLSIDENKLFLCRHLHSFNASVLNLMADLLNSPTQYNLCTVFILLRAVHIWSGPKDQKTTVLLSWNQEHLHLNSSLVLYEQ